nr:MULTISPECIES: hypothetical protein [unclassified Bradyrhizobium]
MFYSCSFGLFGGLSVSLALGLIVYSLPAITRRWLLAHFCFGPVRMLWRSPMFGTHPADTDIIAVGGCESRACPEGCHWSGVVSSDCPQSAPYFPGHTGLRFSANAFRPSLASSVIASRAIWLSR